VEGLVRSGTRWCLLLTATKSLQPLSSEVSKEGILRVSVSDGLSERVYVCVVGAADLMRSPFFVLIVPQ